MRKSKRETAGFERFFKPVLKGVISGFATTSGFIILAAVLVAFGVFHLNTAAVLSAVAVTFGGFFGGFTAAKALEKNGLLCGLFCGGCMFLLMTAVSLAAFRTAPGPATVTRLALLLLAGGLGGIFGVERAGKRKAVKP